MKGYLILIFFVLLGLQGWGQDIPDEFLNHPNGIEFSYGNLKEKKCQPFLEIFDSASYFYKCHNDKSKKKQLVNKNDSSIIQRFRNIITFDFILQLQECCQLKNCFDSNNAYWIFKKENDRVEFITIDISFVDKSKCGNDLLLQLIKDLGKLSDKY